MSTLLQVALGGLALAVRLLPSMQKSNQQLAINRSLQSTTEWLPWLQIS